MRNKNEGIALCSLVLHRRFVNGMSGTFRMYLLDSSSSMASEANVLCLYLNFQYKVLCSNCSRI